MKIGKYFTLSELCVSGWAQRNGVSNVPNEAERENLILLVQNVLDPLREEVGPIIVNSGFRNLKVNTGIGGSKTSDHMLGRAADIRHKYLSTIALTNKIIELKLPFDQVIEENYSWVHVSHRPNNRGQMLKMRKINNKSVYLPFDGK